MYSNDTFVKRNPVPPNFRYGHAIIRKDGRPTYEGTEGQGPIYLPLDDE